MTQKEINKFLANTKVYVNGKSREIQEKLFSLGYSWNEEYTGTDVRNTKAPFLFIYEDTLITMSSDMNLFCNHEHREITAEEILSLELTEPDCKPFKTQEECWNEIHRHPDFGWIIYNKTYYSICDVTSYGITIILHDCDPFCIDFKSCTEEVTFVDGTPFGIKEE